MAADDVFVDTNVLIEATSAERPLRNQALRVIDGWPNENRRLCVSGQVLREYLVVATRPESENGLGLSVEDALENVVAFAHRCTVLGEDESVVARLHALLRRVSCTGKRIHDANLVATALAARVPRLVTANDRDFARFADALEVIALESVDERER